VRKFPNRRRAYRRSSRPRSRWTSSRRPPTVRLARRCCLSRMQERRVEAIVGSATGPPAASPLPGMEAVAQSRLVVVARWMSTTCGPNGPCGSAQAHAIDPRCRPGRGGRLEPSTPPEVCATASMEGSSCQGRSKTHPSVPVENAPPLVGRCGRVERLDDRPLWAAVSAAEASPEGEPERRSPRVAVAGRGLLRVGARVGARRGVLRLSARAPRVFGQAISAAWAPGRAPRSLSRRR
jgi:hypothetical protein